jgi:cyclopropane fatty-acyl-phospholipid synthase-like methyltransferase
MDLHRLQGTAEIPDHSEQMGEEPWWDLWNTFHRTKDDNDEVSSELFAHAAAVINGLALAGDRRILEVACGAGLLSRKLVYSSYHGLDLSPAAIELARQKSELMELSVGASSPTYEAADFHEWPLAVQPVDIVVCVDAIAYFRDQEFCFRKFAKSLRAGGRLVLTTVAPFVYDRIERTKWAKLESGPVSCYLSRSVLHDFVRRAGFKIERSYTIMPRGNRGILRIVNSRKLNGILGPGAGRLLRQFKEYLGLGQYRVLIARKVD